MFLTFIINLKRDIERKTQLEQKFNATTGFKYFFVEGVDGRTLPKHAREILSGGFFSDAKGTIGCFLSHVGVWEMVAQQSVAPYCLILEDDVDLKYLNLLHSLALPNEFDLIFINHRMAYQRLPADLRLVDIPTAIRGLDMTKGAGADGYILSKKGAEKLLSAIDEDYVCGHVDGRLLRYCVTEAHISTLASDSLTYEVISNHHSPIHPPKWGILTAYATSIPIVVHVGFKSTRAEDD